MCKVLCWHKGCNGRPDGDDSRPCGTHSKRGISKIIKSSSFKVAGEGPSEEVLFMLRFEGGGGAAMGSGSQGGAKDPPFPGLQPARRIQFLPCSQGVSAAR